MQRFAPISGYLFRYYCVADKQHIMNGNEHTRTSIRRNSPTAWILASRPKTLAGAAVPVVTGVAAAVDALGWGGIMIVPAVLCLLFALIMQIAANLINDYFDCASGNDGNDRIGPLRACAMGWVTPAAMKKAIAATVVVACLCGLPLVLYGGMEMILVGALCVVFCFLYTTHLSYMGLGDVLVLIFFGIVPVTMTYYIQTRTVTIEALLLSVACGLVIDTLLIINNYRDFENDRRSGKNTLVTRMGIRAGGYFYLAAGLTAAVVAILTNVFNGSKTSGWLPLIYVAMHVITYIRMIRIKKGSRLNAILGETSRNIIIFGLTTAMAILIRI